MDGPEPPDPEAEVSEIQEWMDEHFVRAINEGIRDALEGDGQEGTLVEGDGA